MTVQELIGLLSTKKTDMLVLIDHEVSLIPAKEVNEIKVELNKAYPNDFQETDSEDGVIVIVLS